MVDIFTEDKMLLLLYAEGLHEFKTEFSGIANLPGNFIGALKMYTGFDPISLVLNISHP